MAKSTKTKWLLGLTGTALSAFVVTQITDAQPKNSPISSQKKKLTDDLSKEEKQYVSLDWTNFNIDGAVVSGGAVQNVQKSDRQTRRS